MNSAKFDGLYYAVRDASDLKDIVIKSTDMFRDDVAYLQKDRPGGTFQPITYGQVREDMDSLGTRLIELGLKDKKIAVIGETSYHWILTYFATVCGVGVIVPLDKNLPEDELKSLIRRSGASALVYSKKSEKNIKSLFEDPYDIEYFISMAATEHTDKVWSLPKLIEEGKVLLKNGIRDYTDVEIDPDQMSTLMFTSGTTGMAKGVMLSHKNIAANVQNMSRLVHLHEDWVILSILPIHHAYEMTCVIWTTFFQGKTIAICEGIRYIQKNMVEVGASCMVGVPLVFEKMYKGMWKQAESRGEAEKLRKAIDLSRRMKLYNNPRLMKKMFKAIHQTFGNNMKLFIAGGAAIDPKVIEDFEAMGLPMIQGYGMTENAPIIAVNQDRYSIAASVGRPMPGTTVMIHEPDEDGVGEIWVKGPSVMLGYYENEEATEEALQDGWLHTGDLGYMDEEGFLYLTGRQKTVIVTKGGKNIFPEEIETVLLENDLIKETLVHGVSDKKVGNVIITADIYPNYQLLKERYGEMNSGEVYNFYRDLIDEVNEKLPPYKIIKRVNIRDTEFEKTTTGKIKRYGNFTEGSEENKGEPEFIEIRNEERRTAQRIMDCYNKSADPYIKYRGGMAIAEIKHMFERLADQFGDYPAFIQSSAENGDMRVTYKEALSDVNGLGTALLNRGMKRANIGLLGKISYKWCCSYLATIGGVGTIVPIDRDFSEEMMDEIIHKGQLSCVLCDNRHVPFLKNVMDEEDSPLKLLVVRTPSEDFDDPRIVSWMDLVEEGKKQVSMGDRQFLNVELVASNPAAIHITTGEDGNLKGVILSNTNITDNLMAMGTMIDFNPGDVVISELPAHHSFKCMVGFLLTLYKGGTVAFYDSGDKFEAYQKLKPNAIIGSPLELEDIYKLLKMSVELNRNTTKLNIAFGISGFADKLGLKMSRTLLSDLLSCLGGDIEKIICVGGSIDGRILEFFNKMGIVAVEGYGMTECTSLVAINPDDKKMRYGSAGRLLPNMEAKVIDKDEDGIGEICLRGNNVMMGYFDDPVATENILQDDWIMTGDLGYIEDGEFIYIKGRKRSAITLKNGRRIYPEVIETKLRSLEEVSDAFVWADDDDKLVATVVPEEHDIDGTRILEAVNRKIASGLELDRVVIRRQPFVRTTGGKIRRNLLINREDVADEQIS